jgi:hypothetical protein
MIRTLFASACVVAALTLAAGCGGQSGSGGQPKLANPNDSRIKDAGPAGVGGPAGGGGQPKAAPQ